MTSTPRTDLVVKLGCCPEEINEDGRYFMAIEVSRTIEREVTVFCHELLADTDLSPSGQVVDAMIKLMRMQRELIAARRCLIEAMNYTGYATRLPPTDEMRERWNAALGGQIV